MQQIHADGTVWVRDAHDTRKREHTRRLPAEYIREHAHLSYAATAYGVQGITAPASHTILTEGIGGAAVYVGMTRGKNENALHIVAESTEEARALFVEAMERDLADRGLVDATERVAEAVRGLVNDGPVKLVNTRVAQLVKDAEQAERQAAMWERIGERLGEQQARQQAEKDEQAAVIQAATEHAGRVRAEVQEPLIVQAVQDGTEHQAVTARGREAHAKIDTAGRFGKRAARKASAAANAQARQSSDRFRTRWGEPPRYAETLTDWAARVAEQVADRDPRVLDAQQTADAARAADDALDKRHRTERRALHSDIFGAEQVRQYPLRYEFVDPEHEIATVDQKAADAREEIAQLRGMPVREAEKRIEAQRYAVERARLAREARARKLRSLSHDHDFSTSSGLHHDGPALGL